MRQNIRDWFIFNVLVMAVPYIIGFAILGGFEEGRWGALWAAVLALVGSAVGELADLALLAVRRELRVTVGKGAAFLALLPLFGVLGLAVLVGAGVYLWLPVRIARLALFSFIATALITSGDSLRLPEMEPEKPVFGVIPYGHAMMTALRVFPVLEARANWLERALLVILAACYRQRVLHITNDQPADVVDAVLHE